MVMIINNKITSKLYSGKGDMLARIYHAIDSYIMSTYIHASIVTIATSIETQ